MEHPNKLIDSFAGVVDLGPELGREAIQPTNLLLRGCVLRNTDWVVGIVVNTGHDTKIMMTSTKTKVKSSYLETCASKQIQKVIVLLIIVAVTGSVGQVIWNRRFDIKHIWYLDWTASVGQQWVVQFFYLFLLHASFIPVSLYVSMSATRFFQSYFMNSDRDMYYEKSDIPMAVRTMTLNEELGQISHIFSDKTGTLTCNTMDFRKMSIDGISYGVGITEIGKAAWKLQGKEIPEEVLLGEAKAKERSVPHVSFYCPTYDTHIAENRHHAVKIRQFFRFLAICHDVVAEKSDAGTRLSASNPDDEALVCAAEYFGFQFCDRIEKSLVLNNKVTGKQEFIEVLETIAFTSARKRMSVIIRDIDGQIKIVTKGADTAMLERLRSSSPASASGSGGGTGNSGGDTSGERMLLERTDADMRTYAQEGLRCLVIAYADIEADKFANWVKDYRLACRDVSELERKKNGEMNSIDALEDMIERNLTLVGATGIEDRLQDGVPECIARLTEAGINIWVLTGDKEETAINIAVACNLVLPPPYMKQILINKDTAPGLDDIIAIFRREIQEIKGEQIEIETAYEAARAAGNADVHKSASPRALIIDGPSLITVMADGAPKPTGARRLSRSMSITGSSSGSGKTNKFLDPTAGPDSARSLLLKLSTSCRAVVGCRVSPDQKREMVRMVKYGVPGVRTLAIGDGANDVAMIQVRNKTMDYMISCKTPCTVCCMHHNISALIKMCAVISLFLFI
jgi:phospholipid-translocating P-type ATPase (flippase)